MSKKTTYSEPFIRLSKNNAVPMWKGWLIRIAAVAAAFVVCAFVIVLITDLDPIEVYAAMIKGNFGSNRKIWSLMQNIAMLLCVALAVTPAYKMKFWNIGAEGQVIMGGVATAACMIWFGNSMNPVLLIMLMTVVSCVAGAIWGLIPAVFKAYFNTNESLFTLMMNYVAMQIASYCVCFWENPKGSNAVGIINSETNGGWLPTIGGQKYLLNILIVLALTVFMFVYLKYSKHGYEIAVVGESENTARYIGINVKKVILRTMALSGAMCGIAGLLLVSGTNHTISSDTAGGRGFTAIMVSWLAKFNPFVMIITSFLIVFFDRGASEIATRFRLDESMADILTGIILFFIIGSEFFINYKINFRTKKNGEVSK